MTSKRREALLQIDRAMLRLRSTQTNRRVRVLMERRLGGGFNRSHSLIVDAVGESMDAGGELSIGKVAERLGIDPTRASRMVRAAVTAGYVERTACEDDARRICLRLNDSGRELLQQIRSARIEAFTSVIAAWPDADCSELARLLTKFAEPRVVDELALPPFRLAPDRLPLAAKQ
jgi:DNA-binding MarR family transcriptional regulator